VESATISELTQLSRTDQPDMMQFNPRHVPGNNR
jgi:hypothetical protein